MERDLFSFVNTERRGRNKTIFYDEIKKLPDGSVVKISPFTSHLRAMGSCLSESSTERYARWSKEWFGIEFESLGKGRYKIHQKG